MLSSEGQKANNKVKETNGQSDERDLQVWRRKLDDMRNKTKKKQEHL